MKTGLRKYKNFSHIGWLTSMVAWSFTVLVATILIGATVISHDLCSVYGQIDDDHTVANFTRLWPADIQPILDSCMFGSTAEEIGTTSS